MPEILSMIQVKRMTPAPAVLVVVRQSIAHKTFHKKRKYVGYQYEILLLAVYLVPDVPDLLGHFRPDQLHRIRNMGKLLANGLPEMGVFFLFTPH